MVLCVARPQASRSCGWLFRPWGADATKVNWVYFAITPSSTRTRRRPCTTVWPPRP